MTDKELESSFQEAFRASHCTPDIENDLEDPCVTVIDNFEVETYIYTLQDKLTEILRSTVKRLYLKIEDKPPIRTPILSIDFSIGSNCYLIVTINYVDGHKGLSRLRNRDLTVCVYDQDKHKRYKMIMIRDSDTNEVQQRQLVINDQNKTVMFPILDKLEMNECSIYFKVSYLDYEFI
jgi:hypothetical protein